MDVNSKNEKGRIALDALVTKAGDLLDIFTELLEVGAKKGKDMPFLKTLHRTLTIKFLSPT